jgi:5-methylcytosine-specific restriction endonuclease McrA
MAPIPKPTPRVLSKWHKRLEAERQLKQARAFVKARDGGKCRSCGKPGNQAHHLVYRSHGGKHDPKNLIWTCTKCHSRMHAKVILVSFDASNPAKTVTFTRNTQWDEVSA